MPPYRLTAPPLARRVALLGFSVVAGLLACAALMLAAARPAWAAPNAVDRPYPGSAPCDTTLQACIDGVDPGDTIVIQAGTYITSVTLSQPVSLTGVASNTVILQALAGQRVLTVTGAIFNPTVVISGLTFSGGNVSGAPSYPANCGGGVLLAFNNQPRLVNVIISGNTAALGGGLCAHSGTLVRLSGSQMLSNTATGTLGGGGLHTFQPVHITGGLFQANQCLGGNCSGGGLYAGSTLAVTGTQFLSNTSQGNGGAVRVDGAAVILSGVFEHNQCAVLAGCEGGALFAENTLTVTGTQFISNVAHWHGGAVRAIGASNFVGALFQGNACVEGTAHFCAGGGLSAVFTTTLSGTQFLSNSAMFRGGAVYADGAAVLNGSLLLNNQCVVEHCLGGGMLADGPLVATNSQFINNISAGAYGGVWAVDTATFSGGLFQGNACTQDACQAGGLFASSGVAITGTQFLSNTARGDGGGVAASGPVTLTSTLFQGNGCTVGNCRGGAVMAGSSLNVTGTQFLSNTARYQGGAVRAFGALVINGGLFRGNRCSEADCEGGGVYAGGTLALTGTQIISNTALANGGGVWTSGAATLNSGLFQANACTQAACQGGGLYMFPNAPLTLTAMQFLSNTALAQGGGVNALHTAALTGGVFQANTCTADDCQGGGLFVSHALTVSGTQFINNSARLHGGGVYANAAATLNGALISGNACTQAECEGGGLRVGGALALTNTQALNNAALDSGGGVYALSDATVSGGLFEANACAQDNCFGGGLYVVGGLAVSGTEFMTNSTRYHGGGLYAAGTTTVTSGVFQGNACAQDNCQGGGMHAVNDVTLSGTAFLSNTARFSAGGLYANAGAVALSNGGLFQGNQCTQTGCRGGGLNVNGSVALTGTRFIGNRAVFDGGGLRTAGPATVTNGLFQANTAYQGGGFYHGGAEGQVINTLFANNIAAESGAAVYVNGASGLLALVHNTIGMAQSNNITSAVQVAAGNVGITNTIFVYHDYGIRRSGGTVYQDYNFFAQVGIPADGGVTGGAHSFTGNPAFVDPVDGDFRLAPGSLAFDTGVDAGIYVDFEGQTRPLGSGFDIGYDETLMFRVYLPAVRRP